VIVVDDASEPALRFASLSLKSRQGFQRACNRGLRAAKSDAVLFLNNDVTMTDAGWLDAIRRELRPGVLVGAQLREKEGHAQVDGRAEIISLPDAMEPLVEYYRRVAGEHPDWDDYRAAMVRDRRLVVRLRVERAYGIPRGADRG